MTPLVINPRAATGNRTVEIVHTYHRPKHIGYVYNLDLNFHMDKIENLNIV
jgi:hypothetical protein